MYLSKIDPEIFNYINQEYKRQEYGLEMIASENYTSKAVMEAQGSILTNKYAEGYPGNRYYGGCKYVDYIENLAIERAKKIFSCNYANVQPHSGSQANMGVLVNVLQAGDTVLGMDLNHGGHLTHGAKVSFSGFLFNSVSYKLDPDTQLIDYQKIKELALEYKPKLIIAGYSSYPRIIDFSKFREIADLVGSKLLVDMAHFAGLVAGGEHPSPLPYADFVTSTTHKTLRGPRGGLILTNNQEYAKRINSKIFPGIQGGPLEHVIAGKAVCFKEVLSEDFKEYAKQVIKNAKFLAEELKKYDFQLITNGTDNHLILIDLTNKNITGKDAQNLLEKGGITLNKNSIPGETKSPFITSGIRIGTPALTTRKMKETEMKQIAFWINNIIQERDDESSINSIKQEIKQFCEQFPIYS